MKKLLIALALVVVSSPLYAQSSPVQIICAKGGNKPLCNSVKAVINQSPAWHQSKSGPRYIMLLSAYTRPELPGVIYGGAAYAANLGDPVSSQFPYFINGTAFTVGTSNVDSLAPAIVTDLTSAAIFFADTLASLNKYGTAGPDLSDIDEMPTRFLTDEDFAGQSAQ
jgi:hypothetical protein